MHLLNFRRDASFEVDGERFDWARMRCCVGAHDGARELGAIVRAEVVEEPLAAKTEHLRGPVVVAATHAHLVQRRHVDPRVRRQAHLVLARGTAALLFDEQGHNPIGALARREWRTLVARALRARRCVGAHLHQLGGRIVAQPLAHLGRAASVTHGVVEGEPCLRAIAPDHGGIEDRARHLAVGARRARAIGLAASLEQGEAALEFARVVAAHVRHCAFAFKR